MLLAWIALFFAITLEVLFFVLLKDTAKAETNLYLIIISPLLIGSLVLEQKAIALGLEGSLVYIVWCIVGIIALAVIGHYYWKEYLSSFGVAMISVMAISSALFIQYGYK